MKVTVLNGSGQSAVAGNVSAQLKSAGYSARVGGGNPHEPRWMRIIAASGPGGAAAVGLLLVNYEM